LESIAKSANYGSKSSHTSKGSYKSKSRLSVISISDIGDMISVKSDGITVKSGSRDTDNSRGRSNSSGSHGLGKIAKSEVEDMIRNLSGASKS